MSNVWVAFCVGIFLGAFVAIIIMSLLTINRKGEGYDQDGKGIARRDQDTD